MFYVIGSVILGFVYLSLASSLSTRQRGAKWNVSARDQAQQPLTGYAARLDRAFANFKETFPFFLAAAFAAYVKNRDLEGGQTVLGMQLYFYARIAYLPLYAFGIPYIRSLTWMLSVVGIILVLISAF